MGGASGKAPERGNGTPSVAVFATSSHHRSNPLTNEPGKFQPCLREHSWFELARAESSVVPEQVVVSRILLGPEVTLSHPDAALPPVRIGIDASAFEIAAKLREEWSVPIDDEVLAREEVAPQYVDLSVRWCEIHRDLSLTGVLRNADSRAQLTHAELESGDEQRSAEPA